MERQLIATGATVEEAIENACREMGVSSEDVTPEILQFPKKGFLGFGKVEARVCVTVSTVDDPAKDARKPVQKPRQEQPKPAVKPAEKPAEKKPAAPVEKKAEKPAPAEKKAEKPAVPAEKKQEKPAAETAKPAPREESAAPVSAPAAEEKKAAPAEEKPVLEELPLEVLQPKMDIAQEYLSAIFEKMGIQDIQMRLEPAKNRTILIYLEGGDIGVVIGKRGETLDAIQYLVSLAANRTGGEYVRFTINAGNYREKREETLRALAQRMAKKVLKTGRPAALEPMNPYERRLIHSVVTEIEGVFSKSIGEEPNRKVVIKPVGKPAGGNRRDNNGSRGHNGRPRRPRSEAPREQRPQEDEQQNVPAAPAVEAPAPAPEQTAPPAPPAAPAPAPKEPIMEEIKLYSKIEL